MRSLIFVLILLAADPIFAQENFTYDDHGKRDPFLPLVSSTGVVISYDADLSMNDLDLEGIIGDPSGNNVALVNGKIVKVNDQIGPYVVTAIALDHVEFLKGPEKFVLRLKTRTAI